MTREQVIKALKRFKEYNEEDYCGGDRIQDEHGDWYYRITEQDFEAFEMAIKALEQEPRKGHWIGHREHCENLGVMPSGLGAYEWCSECDCGIDIREWHRNHYNFCPNCGSDNREVEE